MIKSKSSMIKNMLKRQDFNFSKRLGKGAYGVVFKALHLESDTEYAVKIMSIRTQEQHDKDIELQILKNYNHRNMVTYCGDFFQDYRSYIILKLYTGNVYNYMEDEYPGGFTASKTRKWLKQITSAISYLHQNDITHRDIKPENILLDNNENIYLTDFGFSTIGKEKEYLKCGTVDYRSPEQILDLGHNYKIDIWGLGVLAFELSHGEPPFESSTRDETENKIINADYNMPLHISPDIQQYIRSCLVFNPELRPEAKELIDIINNLDNYQEEIIY